MQGCATSIPPQTKVMSSDKISMWLCAIAGTLGGAVAKSHADAGEVHPPSACTLQYLS